MRGQECVKAPWAYIRHYITFSGAGYDEQTQTIVERGAHCGADEVWVYDDAWLMEQEFSKINRWLWSAGVNHAPRGFGWFAWKPFIIMHALSKAQDGDIVLYTDADTYPIADFSMLYDICEAAGGIMLFAAQGRNNRWDCKRETFVAMGMDRPQFWDSQAGVARFMLFQKGPWRVQQFLSEWLAYCLNPMCQTFDTQTWAGKCMPELDGFKEHRCEQAVMGLLAHRYGYKLYREACQFGNGALADGVDANLYGQLFEQLGTCTTKEPVGSRFRRVP